MLKNKKLIIIASAIIVLVLTASLIYYLVRGKENVKDLYFRIETENFVKYMDELQKKHNEREKRYKPFNENPSRSRYELSVKLSSPASVENSFGNLPSQAIDIINSSKLVLNTRYNIKEEKSLTSLAFLLEGLNFADVNIFVDKNTLGLQIPVIYDKYFLIDKNNPKIPLQKFNLDYPINKILLPREMSPYTNFPISEIKNILVEYSNFLKDNISDEQVVLSKNIQNYGFEAQKSGKYDQFTLSFNEDQLKNLSAAFIKMIFKDNRLINITVDKINNAIKLIDEAGYFDLIPGLKPLTEKLLSYSDYNILVNELLDIIENTSFPDGLSMKIIVDSSGNIISRSINLSSKEQDMSKRNYDILFSQNSVVGKIVQSAENGGDAAEIQFNFEKGKSKSDKSESFEGFIKCVNNIWPDFKANINLTSESSENAKKKSINTSYNLIVNLTIEEYKIDNADILINIKKEDSYGESFEMPATDSQWAVDLNTISEEELSEIVKELQFSTAKFLLNNKELIEPFTSTAKR
ncbi:MAG TPA: hypothetical protein GXX20_08460 [Clostridiaceae bacterium]|nr:hypothetical protein [Clostridiaceae bacterium]